MPRRKIGYIEKVNELSGELTKSVSWYSNKFTETFIMLRLTDGIDWYFKLGRNEKNLLLLLHNWSDAKTGRVSISRWQRDYICEKLEINRRQISLVLKNLITNDCIKRISQNDFYVNPAHLFKCSTNEIRERINNYNQFRK